MNHDPECHMRHGLAATAPCMCEMIRAHKSLMQRPEEVAYSKGFAAALSAAVEAVKALPHVPPYLNLIESSDAVAAIEALGGER